MLADSPLPLIATRDIGTAAADAMLRLWFQGSQRRELLGSYDTSMFEAARIIGAPDLKYVQSPQSRAREVIVQIGISPNVAGLILEMSAAWNSRLLAASEVRSASNTTLTCSPRIGARAILVSGSETLAQSQDL